MIISVILSRCFGAKWMQNEKGEWGIFIPADLNGKIFKSSYQSNEFSIRLRLRPIKGKKFQFKGYQVAPKDAYNIIHDPSNDYVPYADVCYGSVFDGFVPKKELKVQDGNDYLNEIIGKYVTDKD